MSSRCRAACVLAGFLLWAGAGCRDGKGSGDDGGGPRDSGTGGAASGAGGATANGAGGAGSGAGGATANGAGGAGTGESGAGGRTDAGAVDAGASDAPKGDGAAASDGGDARADAVTGAGDARDGGADGAAAFAPCPADGGACVVMPLGDSITEGFPDFVGGYRVELFHQANLGGKHITFVGRRMNGPASGMVDGKPFPTGCEGYSGYTIVDAPSIGRTGISGMLTMDAINMFHPHVILLMIGTNDINQSYMVSTAPDRLAALIDMITTAAPNTLLVVAQIVPTTTDATNARIQAYNAAIPALVQTRASAGKHVLRVDMYGTFTARADYKTALMVDDLHPNPAGYTLLGQTWYGVIAPFLR